MIVASVSLVSSVLLWVKYGICFSLFECVFFSNKVKISMAYWSDTWSTECPFTWAARSMASRTLRRRLHHGDVDGHRHEHLEASRLDSLNEPLLGNYESGDGGSEVKLLHFSFILMISVEGELFFCQRFASCL